MPENSRWDLISGFKGLNMGLSHQTKDSPPRSSLVINVKLRKDVVVAYMQLF